MRYLYILIAFWLCQACQQKQVQEATAQPKKAEPIKILSTQELLDLPMTDKKTLVAHFMTGDIDYDFGARPGGLSRNKSWYARNGEFAKFGGLNQVAPMDMFLFKRGERSLEQVVEQELRAAHVAGLEAFHFYYPEVIHQGFMKNYNEVVATFFKVAAEHYPDFKFTLCLSNANEGTQSEKIDRWSGSIRSLFQKVEGYDSWLKTPDGRVIFYLWNNDALADTMEHQPWLIDRFPERIAEVAKAHDDLAIKIGVKAAFMYDLRFPANHNLTKKVLEHFPGVWSWTDNTKHLDDFRKIKLLCDQQKRDFCLTVYPDYYTSKLYWKDRSKGHGMLHYYELKQAQIHEVERHYQNCGLSALYRKLFDFAIEQDLQWISLATWNDFPEGHHIAPELNHNFAPMVLMDFYRNEWRKSGRKIEESLSVFYKKYTHDVQAKYNIKVYTKKSMGPEVLEDYIEVVSILQKPGDIFINGTFVARVQAGLQSTKIPSGIGQVNVQVKRQGEVVLKLIPPQKITDQAFRTDRLTYMYSTRFSEYFTKIYGEQLSEPQINDFVLE
ncbi:hypothetical protein LNTAR_03939 [Lentisphaera araneosa HTCC2155]|uniref:Glycosyl hydrolase family 71 n=1 Tax=Lentisphaera araneosa HTCC2155 TaxID=313628 RepID=A6DUC0_9BACT|nr:endo-1,3-alpha-glucanase family glycosylhydrolase [Lentisphaera araneosa]EDM24763.1 hypothetical protein LNTAR_03939 [Lentisphaera araneosa HTCC2155]